MQLRVQRAREWRFASAAGARARVAEHNFNAEYDYSIAPLVTAMGGGMTASDSLAVSFRCPKPFCFDFPSRWRSGPLRPPGAAKAEAECASRTPPLHDENGSHNVDENDGHNFNENDGGHKLQPQFCCAPVSLAQRAGGSDTLLPL